MSIQDDTLFIDVDDSRTHAAQERYGGKPLLEERGIIRIDSHHLLAPVGGLTRRVALKLDDLVGGLTIGLRYTSAIERAAECWAIWDSNRPGLHHHDVARSTPPRLISSARSHASDSRPPDAAEYVASIRQGEGANRVEGGERQAVSRAEVGAGGGVLDPATSWRTSSRCAPRVGE